MLGHESFWRRGWRTLSVKKAASLTFGESYMPF